MGDDLTKRVEQLETKVRKLREAFEELEKRTRKPRPVFPPSLGDSSKLTESIQKSRGPTNTGNT
jgi:hypothetical protein